MKEPTFNENEIVWVRSGIFAREYRIRSIYNRKLLRPLYYVSPVSDDHYTVLECFPERKLMRQIEVE